MLKRRDVISIELYWTKGKGSKLKEACTLCGSKHRSRRCCIGARIPMMTIGREQGGRIIISVGATEEYESWVLVTRPSLLSSVSFGVDCSLVVTNNE